MGIISIEKLRSHASSESFSKTYFAKLKSGIDTLIESGIINGVVENDHIFYPKYLWQDDKDIELYFIAKDKLIIVTYKDKGVINVRTKILGDILNLEICNLDLKQKDVELYVIFTDGEVIKFSSNDSNDSWKNKFYNAIIEIHRQLL